MGRLTLSDRTQIEIGIYRHESFYNIADPDTFTFSIVESVKEHPDAAIQVAIANVIAHSILQSTFIQSAASNQRTLIICNNLSSFC